MPTVTVRMEEGRFRISVFVDSYRTIDNPHLARALELARLGAPTTWPNPSVGCVIVAADGRVVGEGFHHRAGTPHAEVHALAEAGAAAAGATAYVTLEPCNHTGKTPPCAQALIGAGVARVVIGMADPNPVASGGANALRSTGIEVEFAADPAPFEALNRGWLTRLATGQPFVTVKIGSSLDGAVALRAGVRTAVTGTEGRRVTNALRARAGAVLVSDATVVADDPSLTVTKSHGVPMPIGQPTRVILCRDLLVSPAARVMTDGAAPTVLLVPASLQGAARDLAAGARSGHVSVLTYDPDAGVAGALRALGSTGLGEVLIEAGPRLFGSLVAGGVIDELVTVTAGGLLGSDALHAYAGEPTLTTAASSEGVLPAAVGGEMPALAHPFTPVETELVGNVVVTTWHRATQEG